MSSSPSPPHGTPLRRTGDLRDHVANRSPPSRAPRGGDLTRPAPPLHKKNTERDDQCLRRARALTSRLLTLADIPRAGKDVARLLRLRPALRASTRASRATAVHLPSRSTAWRTIRRHRAEVLPRMLYDTPTLGTASTFTPARRSAVLFTTHGTGIVIASTSTIGQPRAHLTRGLTLGALSIRYRGTHRQARRSSLSNKAPPTSRTTRSI